jgi:hypothetical protein
MSKSPGGRAAKGLRTRLTAPIGGAIRRALAEQMALATSEAAHIRLLEVKVQKFGWRLDGHPFQCKPEC